MPYLRTYRIFISHAWDYSEDYWRVVRFLDEASHFRWENLSVPEHDPVTSDELEFELRRQMRPADVFLIIAGMYAARRSWIDFELSFARRIGKPRLGIVKWGAINIPRALQEHTTLVGWNGASIVQTIRQLALPSGPVGPA